MSILGWPSKTDGKPLWINMISMRDDVHFSLSPKMMKIGVLMRVSDEAQKHDSQLADIKRWLRGHGHDPDDPNQVVWFIEKESVAQSNAKAVAGLNKAIFAGEVKTVLVWKLDRIARSLKDGITTLCDWCDRGVRVVSVTQELDLSGTVGKIVASVLFGVAEIDLINMKERQAAGIAAAKANGVYKGRKKGTLKADPARARELKAKGMKPAEIMKALGIRSRSTLSKYLGN